MGAKPPRSALPNSGYKLRRNQHHLAGGAARVEVAHRVEYYTAFLSDLASHGYVVVGINHPYDAEAVAIPGGRIARTRDGMWSKKMTKEEEETLTNQRYQTFAARRHDRQAAAPSLE